MLRATFLGHHAWLYEQGGRRLLVDPLLDDRFGHTDGVELRVYPPRRFDFAALPPVDAVFLTHEHEGHFDLRSLLRVDRRVPVYVAAWSSAALEGALSDLGFTVRRARSGEPITLDRLVLLPLAADQVNDASIEEWDSLAYLVREADTGNGLFASVDMPPTQAMVKAIRAVMKTPPVWGHTVNHYGHHFSLSFGRPNRRAVQGQVQRLLGWHEKVRAQWAAPPALLVLGGGFCFGGAQKWLNENAFTAEGEQVAKAIAPLLPGERVCWPVPGESLVIDGGQLQAVEPSPFVRALERAEWPSRAFRGDVEWIEDYAPACARTDLTDEELDELARELDGFAAHLYGRTPFRGLCSQIAATDGRKDTFALLLRADAAGGAYVFEYDLRACRFEPASASDPVAEYLAVHECWATDLLETLRGGISPTAIPFGRFRSWSADWRSFALDLNVATFEYAHPLRHPARYQELYRRSAARFEADGIREVVRCAEQAR
jgi:hypothetical protein